jgi:hypothetical protein
MEEKLTNQQKYLKSEKGKRATSRARKKYDKKDPERRKKQKKEYMRKRRKETPSKWR